jgi:hypothetical protein
MRKPPIPRAVPHRSPRERWATAGACGVLALGHAARAAVDAPHAAYLSVLDTLGVAAAVGVAVQLLAIDDPLSWFSAACVAALLGASAIVALTVGLPGSSPTRFAAVSLITIAASAFVIVEAARALTRPEPLRTRPREHRAVRARRGTARAPAAHRDPARPAA